MSETLCRTCRHAIEKPDHERMHRRGFRNCTFKPDWHYVPAHMTCNLQPVRWAPKVEAT